MTVLTKPEVIDTIDELRNRLCLQRQHLVATGGDASVVLVPTMGALHAGHRALVRRAATQGNIVVVSIFVNPLQFGAGEDLDVYPRTLDDDLTVLAEEGVQFVFVPTTSQMYPDGASLTRVTAGAVGSLYEGAARPGHFDGMLTVVNKLLNIVEPDVVEFGQKDAQQAFLVERMVLDLNMRVSVDVVPTVREESGLALSSRNRYLDETAHNAARSLSTGLAAAVEAAFGGVPAAIVAAHAVIGAAPLVKLDYLVVVHPKTFLLVDDDYHGPATMLVAAVVGSTRLIDNVSLDFP